MASSLNESLNIAPNATVTEQPAHDDGAATPAPQQQSTAANTVVRWGPGEMGRGCCWTVFTCPYRASQASRISSITEQERDFAHFCYVRPLFLTSLFAAYVPKSTCLGVLLDPRV